MGTKKSSYEKKTTIKTPLRRVDGMEQIFNKRCRGRPRKNWWETLGHDMSYKGLIEDKAVDRND